MKNDASDNAANSSGYSSNVDELVHPIERLQSIARTMRRHSLHLSKHSAHHRERAWELDKEINEAFKALPEVPGLAAGAINRAFVLRDELKQLRLRATALAEISEELTDQVQRVHEESVAVNEEILALRRKALQSSKEL